MAVRHSLLQQHLPHGGPATYAWGESTGHVFDHNAYVGPHVDPLDDPHAFTRDPQLVDPGGHDDGLDSVEGYQLQNGSPLRGGGRSLEDAGERDFWGHPLPKTGPLSIGAHEPPAGSSRE